MIVAIGKHADSEGGKNILVGLTQEDLTELCKGLVRIKKGCLQMTGFHEVMVFLGADNADCMKILEKSEMKRRQIDKRDFHRKLGEFLDQTKIKAII